MIPDPDLWKRTQALFEEALERPDEERVEFVQQACGDDDTLRAEVESLLASDAVSRSQLETLPFLDSAAAGEDRLSMPIDAVPGFEIFDELHRGGQGVVYRALQLSTKREVALKILLDGPFAGRTTRRRFEREVELVGKLSHPGIVPVFESGLAQGHYYYAMQYIRGIRLDKFVRQQGLAINDTLQLFANVCDAVDYAHQHGVIHRDLKPSNILVDEDGRPHILDFGLAKLGGRNLDETAPVSMTGQVMGTLAYMSPEHASGQPGQVDMRSDVYALGVILYELLLGESPYDLGDSFPEGLAAIISAEPSKPALRAGGIDSEVSTIVLKALSKEKERRYPTAGALGADVLRYLHGDPIEAKRDSAFYTWRKTVKRYFVPGAFVTILVLGIAIGAIVDHYYTGQSQKLSPPLQPLDQDGSYQQADLESQLNTIRDMLRRGDDSQRIIGELRARFEPLHLSDFVSTMSDQRKTDLQVMKVLNEFFASNPADDTIQKFLKQYRARPSPRTSRLVDEIVESLLQLVLTDRQAAEDLADPPR